MVLGPMFLKRENTNTQRIQGIELRDQHVGMKVIYVPAIANGDTAHKLCEVGTLVGWNTNGILVTYPFGKQLTVPANLRWKKD